MLNVISPMKLFWYFIKGSFDYTTSLTAIKSQMPQFYWETTEGNGAENVGVLLAHKSLFLQYAIFKMIDNQYESSKISSPKGNLSSQIMLKILTCSTRITESTVCMALTKDIQLRIYRKRYCGINNPCNTNRRQTMGGKSRVLVV